MRTIAIVNQKGGCGKTTTAINLAAIYARRDTKTLLIDMDSQGHCAAGLSVPVSRIEYSIGDALLADHSHGFTSEKLVWEVSDNLFLAPSTVMLAALESPGGGLHQLEDKDRRLESLLKCIDNDFDLCLIDCPPTIGLLTFNALRAAREAIIPVETGFFALRGAENQWATIQRTIQHIGRPIACHLLPTLHNPDSRLARNILTALRRQFAGQILPTIIHMHEELREATSYGQPVIEYAAQSDACRDFEDLVDWLDDHVARPIVDIETFSEEAPVATRTVPYRKVFGIGSTPVGARSFAPPKPIVSGAQIESDIARGGRAAELARRIHTVASSGIAEHIESSSTLCAEREGASESVRLTTAHESPFGVKQTDVGVQFIQPGPPDRKVSVAGDFNHWSPTATPLRFRESTGMFETTIRLPPGEHPYCLVVDGQWHADQYNAARETNRYGEARSIVTVT